jgi:hypothetical protein
MGMLSLLILNFLHYTFWNKLTFQVQERIREKYESALKILKIPNILLY